MSKSSRHFFEMQEDARELTREEFVQKHGSIALSVWDSENDFGFSEAEIYEQKQFLTENK